MRKIFASFFATLAVFTSLASPVGAQNLSATTTQLEPVKPIIRPIPWPICQDYTVTPSSPLKLSGSGKLTGNGVGRTVLAIKSGSLTVGGAGAVAIRSNSNTKLESSGFNQKYDLGDWVLFLGQGKLNAKGQGFEVRTWRKMSVELDGTTASSFIGKWTVHNCQLQIIKAVPEVDTNINADELN